MWPEEGKRGTPAHTGVNVYNDPKIWRRPSGISASVRRNLSLAGALLLAPFATLHYVDANYGVAALLSILVVALVYSAWRLHGVGRSLLQGSLVMLIAAAAVAWTIYSRGQVGIYWAYPVVLLFHIILDRRQALAGSALFVALIVPVTWSVLGPMVAARVLVTMVLTSWSAHIFAARYERQQEELERLVRIDPLTGGYNRRHFEDCVEEALANKLRYSRPISLVLFDIDHFKSINDRFGHRAGDEVLRWIVTAVNERIRRSDALFRYGGDEFVVLMPQTDLHHAGKVAEDLRRLVAEGETPFEFPLSLSVGVSELCRDEPAESWLRRADQALYDAKRGGRDQVTVSPSTVAVNH